MWLLTTPVTAFRGWQVSSVAVDPVLERIGVTLTVSVVPVAVVVTMVEARRRETLGDRFIMPWWCVVAITLLGFPVLFSVMSFAYDRMHGHGVIASVLLTLIWLALHAVALLGLAIAGWRGEVQAEPVAAAPRTSRWRRWWSRCLQRQPVCRSTARVPLLAIC
ncbi:MAG TPA: hypothetical protein VFC19_52310 [Candidatus Limnocylindrales bacterium]|nr:hypothetical protein [Candidatus Limnocylindrales bacterium]